jgi:hypothetical protein
MLKKYEQITPRVDTIIEVKYFELPSCSCFKL